ncbi:MAG: N-6 DNA methylase, partial [Thermoplasmatales archaeon]|nr:N-6 DNA methylase [Thermoplasmatales archaeon]
GRQKKGEDPVIHFYEDFLREYDPKQKVKRGVFYTPDPVVSFIVRSVDYLLRTEFDCPDGLADTSTIPVTFKNAKVNGEVVEKVEQVPKVQILDPATGTGTFLKYVIDEIKKTFDENHKGLSKEELKKEWNRYVDKHLLSRVFGFELLMAPYAIAHLKLGLKLRETEYDFLSHQRLGVSLTNALESGTASAETLKPYLGWLAQESKYSNYIKTAKNISVIVGNPPYSNYGMLNRNAWILRLLADYKKDLNEKKINIDDDYIKFLRFAHWEIEKTGKGIVGVITNNSYIDGVTHRVMRKKLLETFDRIYILNLHGNSNKGETDKNVFDIRVGVSIALFIKLNKPLSEEEKEVYYYSTLDNNLLTREAKYKFLLENSVKTIKWEKIIPQAPHYWFVKKNLSLQEEYTNNWSLTEVFKVYGSGIGTDRDKLFIDFNKDNLVERIKTLLTGNYTKNFAEVYGVKNSSSYNLLNKIKNKKFNEDFLKIELYRSFDFRWIYYDHKIISRPNYQVMQHLLKGGNLELVSVRQIASSEWKHIFIADKITDRDPLSARTSERSYFFPLYLYSKNKLNKSEQLNVNEEEIPLKSPNFTEKFTRFIGEKYTCRNTPEEILGYIYAVLHSQTYREKYYEFLKGDFPRVPFTSRYELFSKLSKLGEQLVSLHLMKSDKLDDLITEFKGEGDNVVAAIGKNSYKDGKLKINRTQYFEGIPEEVYNFHIGG